MGSHCDPVTPAPTQVRVPGIPGLGNYYDITTPRRGVIVTTTGFQDAAFSPGFVPTPNQVLTPPVTSLISLDATTGLTPNYFFVLISQLLNDGWVIMGPSRPETGMNAPLSPGSQLYSDVSTDLTVSSPPPRGFGARYRATCATWYDHIALFVANKWPGCPIIVMGVSAAGWTALQWLSDRANSGIGANIVGAIAICPATVWSNVALSATTPSNFNALNTSGMDIALTDLNNIPSSLPVLISCASGDTLVGFSNTTYAGSTQAVATLPGTLAMTDTSKLNVQQIGGIWGPCVQIAVTGSSTVAWVTVQYTGISGGNLTGCTRAGGAADGNIVNGASVVANRGPLIASTASGAGKSVTSQLGGGFHGANLDIAGSYYPIAGPTTLLSIDSRGSNVGLTGAETFDPTNAFVSGSVAVYASDNTWHTFTYTGVGSTTVGGLPVSIFQGVQFTAGVPAGGLTISLGAPIANTGTVKSIPYWVNQNIDPSCPAIH